MNDAFLPHTGVVTNLDIQRISSSASRHHRHKISLPSLDFADKPAKRGILCQHNLDLTTLTRSSKGKKKINFFFKEPFTCSADWTRRGTPTTSAAAADN